MSDIFGRKPSNQERIEQLKYELNNKPNSLAERDAKTKELQILEGTYSSDDMPEWVDALRRMWSPAGVTCGTPPVSSPKSNLGGEFPKPLRKGLTGTVKVVAGDNVRITPVTPSEGHTVTQIRSEVPSTGVTLREEEQVRIDADDVVYTGDTNVRVKFIGAPTPYTSQRFSSNSPPATNVSKTDRQVAKSTDVAAVPTWEDTRTPEMAAAWDAEVLTSFKASPAHYFETQFVGLGVACGDKVPVQFVQSRAFKNGSAVEIDDDLHDSLLDMIEYHARHGIPGLSSCWGVLGVATLNSAGSLRVSERRFLTANANQYSQSASMCEHVFQLGDDGLWLHKDHGVKYPRGYGQ